MKFSKIAQSLFTNNWEDVAYKFFNGKYPIEDMKKWENKDIPVDVKSSLKQYAITLQSLAKTVEVELDDRIIIKYFFAGNGSTCVSLKSVADFLLKSGYNVSFDDGMNEYSPEITVKTDKGNLCVKEAASGSIVVTDGNEFSDNAVVIPVAHTLSDQGTREELIKTIDNWDFNKTVISDDDNPY